MPFSKIGVVFFASKPAPTLECVSNVGAGLLAKAVLYSPKICLGTERP
ncbi:hypothetical protein OKW11_002592 [Pseudomonas baetica]|nr:hypothetical protein [Pseudomonas baetica]